MSHDEAQSVVVRSERILHVLMAAAVFTLVMGELIFTIPAHFGVAIPGWAEALACVAQGSALVLIAMILIVAGNRYRAYAILARAAS